MIGSIKIFETIKKHSKNFIFLNLINKYKSNIKESWQVIKEAVGKGKVNPQASPKKIFVNKKNIKNFDPLP